MTSFAFILGVAPLAVATGAGAEMRQSLGTAVLFGMIGVTCFGLLFTPAFFTIIRKLGRKEHTGGSFPELSPYSASRDDREQAAVRAASVPGMVRIDLYGDDRSVGAPAEPSLNNRTSKTTEPPMGQSVSGPASTTGGPSWRRSLAVTPIRILRCSASMRRALQK
jgi:hypothetical protein